MSDSKNNTGDRNSGNGNSGDRNSGNGNSGDRNSGYWNSGYCNSGYWNSGNGNSGDGNSGYWNSGYCNSGYWNSGDWNSGNGNSGDWNLGNGNSGDCNSGDRNSGWFNSDEPSARFFNKESNVKLSEFLNGDACPHWNEFYLTRWIASSEMSAEEKKINPSHETCGGYLKTYSYKDAWANFWSATSEENKKKFLNLPNFDADIFLEITGIDVRKKSCAEKIVEIDGKKFKLVEVA